MQAFRKNVWLFTTHSFTNSTHFTVWYFSLCFIDQFGQILLPLILKNKPSHDIAENVQISDQFVLNLLLIALDHETCLLLTRLLAYHGRVESHLRNSFGFSLCVCTNQLPNLIIMGIFDRKHILRSTFEFFSLIAHLPLNNWIKWFFILIYSVFWFLE